MAGDPGRQVGPSRGGSRPRTWHSRQVRHVLRHLWDRWAARHPRVASGPGQRRYLRNLRRFRYSAGRCGSPLPPSRQRSGAPVFHTNPRARPPATDERSRHLPEARRPEAAGRGLGDRAALDRRAAHGHRWAHRAVGQGVHPPAAQARRLPVALHARLPFGGHRGQGRLQAGVRRHPAGEGLRDDAGAQLRVRDQRARDRRVRLPHRPRAEPDRLSGARRPLGPLPGGGPTERSPGRSVARALQPRGRQGRALLPADRDQPGGGGDPDRPAPRAGDNGHRNGEDSVAFQICWKLWTARWNRTGEHRRPRILYLADRYILVDRPKDGIFAEFGDARCKIESGEVVKSREMYFGIYQALAEDERRAGLFRSFPSDFFDLVIVDECHRGSARDESSWRVILDHFQAAVQLGMTATPLREETRDTYLYFGDPIYTVQPAAGDRRRLPRALPGASRGDRMGRGRLAPEQGRAGPLRSIDPRRRIPYQGLRADRGAPRAHRDDRPAP